MVLWFDFWRPLSFSFSYWLGDLFRVTWISRLPPKRGAVSSNVWSVSLGRPLPPTHTHTQTHTHTRTWHGLTTCLGVSGALEGSSFQNHSPQRTHQASGEERESWSGTPGAFRTLVESLVCLSLACCYPSLFLLDFYHSHFASWNETSKEI